MNEVTDARETLLRLARFWLTAGDGLREHQLDPHPHSAAGFDHSNRIGKESPPWVASGKLMAAYDGARAAALLWRAGEVHLLADYALLRVVVEGAGVAWWITSARDPVERALRSFRVALDDLQQAQRREQFAVSNAVTMTGRSKRQQALDGVNRELERLQTEASRAGLPVSERIQKKPLSMPSLMIEAERTIDGASDLGFSLLWSIASTSAHGSLTAVEQLSLRSDLDEMTALTNPNTIATFALEAAHLLKAAHASWIRYASRVDSSGDSPR